MAVYPPWISLRLRLKGDDLQAPLLPLIGPLREAILQNPAARFCAYEPYEPRNLYYLLVDAADGANEALFAFVRAQAASPRFQSWIDEAEVGPFDSLTTEDLGGEPLVGALPEIYHHQSEACLRFFSSHPGGPPPNALLFAMAGTLSLLDAVCRSRQEKKEIIERWVGALARRGDFKPSPEAWRGALSALRGRVPALDDCFPGLSVVLERLSPRLDPAALGLLAQLRRHLEGPGSLLARSARAQWPQPFADAVARRIVHPLWVRLRLDNLKEMLGLALLAGDDAGSLIGGGARS